MVSGSVQLFAEINLDATSSCFITSGKKKEIKIRKLAESADISKTTGNVLKTFRNNFDFPSKMSQNNTYQYGQMENCSLDTYWLFVCLAQVFEEIRHAQYSEWKNNSRRCSYEY